MMYAIQQQRIVCVFYLAITILPLLCNAQISGIRSGGSSSSSSRRRSTSGKQAIEEISEKSAVPDQIALAASRSDGQQQQQHYHRLRSGGGGGGVGNNDAEHDYSYSNLEMNLIRPEHESAHAKLQSHFPSSLNAVSAVSNGNHNHNHIHNDATSLEDAESAAEYVAKAMKMAYGTRLKEPIRIADTTSQSSNSAGSSGSSSITSTVTTTTTTHNVEHKAKPQQKPSSNFDTYYERLNKQQQQQHQPQQQQPQHKQHSTSKQDERQQQALLEAQMQAELQAQLAQQAQLLAVESTGAHGQSGLQTAQTHQVQGVQTKPQAQPQKQQEVPPAAASVYEKGPVTRSYEVYDDSAEPSGSSGTGVSAGVYDSDDERANSAVERYYRTRHVYHQPTLYRNNIAALEQEAEDKVRVSASTEIPKAEIMKQIEKSVLKYMKELEAEGKIITAPQEPAKTYYKVVTVPAAPAPVREEEKRGYTSTTMRPKYSAGLTTTTTSYHHHGSGGSGGLHAGGLHTGGLHTGGLHTGGLHTGSLHSGGLSSSSSGTSSINLPGRPHPHHLHNVKHAQSSKQRYQSETETAYQAPDVADAMAPNVEFIYKIKTRAPLQTATVKTVSKPYTLPLKGNIEHFDHTAALKNIEEFDLSHVVTTPENDERVVVASSTSKPQKLYFNSEIYHDINSLPYKPEKLRIAEYRNKLKSNTDLHPDFKGYTGYFAEPAPSSMELDKDGPSGPAAATSPDDGYPVLNPYQFILKKEPLPNKYDETPTGAASWEHEHTGTRGHLKTSMYGVQKGSGLSGGSMGGVGGAGGSSLEYDSYSPKFNNNPEGYGYQHTYKTHVIRGSASGGGVGIKRGKRGGGVHPSSAQLNKKAIRGSNAGSVGGAHLKDLEASLALRPPPK